MLCHCPLPGDHGGTPSIYTLDITGDQWTGTLHGVPRIPWIRRMGVVTEKIDSHITVNRSKTK